MELHPTRRLSDGLKPSQACRRYLYRLPIGSEQRRELLLRAARGGESDPRAEMIEVHRALAAHRVEEGNPAYDSVRRRLELAYGLPHEAAAPVIASDAQGRVRVVTTPPLERTSMVPGSWPPRMFWSLRRKGNRTAGNADRGSHTAARASADSPDPRGRWHYAGMFRRIVLGLVLFAQTFLATDFMTSVLPYHGRQPLEVGILVLFAILFCWVSSGFWTAVIGFVLLLFGRDRHAISRSAAGDAPIDPRARTAIVMPICNENVSRVFAGLRATYESLSRTGALSHFDFFVLSDSGDPDARIAETEA